MSIRSMMIAGAAIALAVTGGVAIAQDNEDLVVTGRAPPSDFGNTAVRSRVVSYRDLDLSNYDGARTLLQRIDGAAKTVCSPEASVRDFNDNVDYRGCMYDAVSNAVADVNTPTVSDLYQRW